MCVFWPILGWSWAKPPKSWFRPPRPLQETQPPVQGVDLARQVDLVLVSPLGFAVSRGGSGAGTSFWTLFWGDKNWRLTENHGFSRKRHIFSVFGPPEDPFWGPREGQKHLFFMTFCLNPAQKSIQKVMLKGSDDPVMDRYSLKLKDLML